MFDIPVVRTPAEHKRAAIRTNGDLARRRLREVPCVACGGDAREGPMVFLSLVAGPHVCVSRLVYAGAPMGELLRAIRRSVAMHRRCLLVRMRHNRLGGSGIRPADRVYEIGA